MLSVRRCLLVDPSKKKKMPSALSFLCWSSVAFFAFWKQSIRCFMRPCFWLAISCLICSSVGASAQLSSSSWHNMNVHSAHVLPLHHCSFFSTVEPMLLAVRLEHVSRFPEFAALVARYFPFVFLLCLLLWGEEARLLQGVLEGFLHLPVGACLLVSFLPVCAAPTAGSLSFPKRFDTTSTGWGR